MSALDRPSLALVEVIQTKLKEASSGTHDGVAPVVLTTAEIDALRYLCSVYPLSEDIRARVLRRARSRSQRIKEGKSDERHPRRGP